MIYHVFANRQNIGDWLAARAIQSQLAPRPVREMLIDEPFVEDSMRQLRQATEGDLVVIGGGGLLLDYFMPFWSEFDEISRRVPFVIWGVGFCDSKEQITRPPYDLMNRIIRRSRLCVLRDELTRSALPDLDLPEPVICPSVLLLDEPTKKHGSIVHSVHYGLTGHERYERMVEIVRSFAKRTGREYLELTNEIEPDDLPALDREIGFYRRSDLVVSTRLHGCIIGLASGCKVLAVSGDRKIDAFMKQASLEQWVIELEHFERVPQRLERLHEQPAVATGFFGRARSAHRAIGRRVAQIADEVQCATGSRA